MRALAVLARAARHHLYPAERRAVLLCAAVNDRAHRVTRKAVLRAYRRTLKRHDLPFKAGKFLGSLPVILLGLHRRLGHARVIILAVPDISRHNGAAHRALPFAVRRGRDKLCISVVVGYLDLTGKRAGLEAVKSERNATRPPSGRYLGDKKVLLSAERGDIVFIFEYAAAVVGPTRLVFVSLDTVHIDLAYAYAVHEHIEYTESRRAHAHRFDAARWIGRKRTLYGKKPVAARQLDRVAVVFHILPRIIVFRELIPRVRYKFCRSHD